MKKNQLIQAAEQAARGDAEAFARIYAYFERQVYYFALRITKNEADAGDVLQETMLNLYKNLPSLQDAGKVGSYVMRIAYHCSLKALKKGRMELADDEELERVPDTEDQTSPEEYVESMEERNAMLNLIDHLSEGQRTVITLFYYQNYSIKKIAEILDVSESVVKTRLSRGRDNLKTAIARQKGAIAAFVLLLLLPRFLRMDAKAACTSQVRAAAWEAVSGQIGAPTAAVTGPPPMPRWPRYWSGARVVTGTGAAVFGVSATALAAILLAASVQGVSPRPSDPAPAVSAPPPASAAGVISPTTPTASEEDASTEAEIPPDEDMVTLDGGEFVTAAPVASVPEEVAASSGEEVEEESEAPEPVFFRAPNFLVRCAKGQTISQREILRKAQATLSRPASITMQYYNQIDFSTPGEYGLYLQATDETGETSPRIGVIVIVEG